MDQLPIAEPVEKKEHPVSALQRNFLREDDAREMHCMRLNHGWALSATKAMDRSLLAGSRRMGGLRSSHALLNQYNGNNSMMNYTDFLGLPQFSSEIAPRPRTLFETEFLGEEVISTQVKSTKLTLQ